METILKNELHALELELIEKYHALGMKASCGWEKSLQVEVTPYAKGIKGRIVGVDYTWYMQHGRSFGKMPPIKAIEQWIQNKGVFSVEKKNSVTGLAFAIAKKIAREGTIRFRERDSRPPFIEAVVTPQRIDEILKKVGYQYSMKVQAEIIGIIKAISKAYRQ